MGHLRTRALICLVGTLTAAGCAGAHDKTEPRTSKFKACMVLDAGGIDDRSFNQASWAGLQSAARHDPDVAISYVSSTSQNDYAPNLVAEVHQGCNVIIAAGGLMETAVHQVAKRFPRQRFAEVDAPSTASNVSGLQFNTSQAAFLAGYLAGAMSRSRVVGTFGGLATPPTTVYMDGFWEGVRLYNMRHHAHVRVLGWDERHPTRGTFANSFTDQSKGRSIAESFRNQDADIVFPVAGATGLGAAAAAKSADGQLHVIWVDTDGCASAPQYCGYFLTSATKGIAGAVDQYVTRMADHRSVSRDYVGTLKNGGVGIAPYHRLSSTVPSAVRREIGAVKGDIVTGKITIQSKAQPR